MNVLNRLLLHTTSAYASTWYLFFFIINSLFIWISFFPCLIRYAMLANFTSFFFDSKYGSINNQVVYTRKQLVLHNRIGNLGTIFCCYKNNSMFFFFFASGENTIINCQCGKVHMVVPISETQTVICMMWRGTVHTQPSLVWRHFIVFTEKEKKKKWDLGKPFNCINISNEWIRYTWYFTTG